MGERQSIECRAFLFFPDFEPNTCPALPSDAVAESVDPVEGDAEVEAAVQKTRVDRHHEFLAWLRENVAHDHLSQEGRLARNCADDCVFVDEEWLGGETCCTAEADEECKQGCGSEQPRGGVTFPVARCCGWLAWVCLCQVPLLST